MLQQLKQCHPTPNSLCRATWYDHPHTGSCGYGKLDGYTFGPDAVAAMPDVFRDYNTSCGRRAGQLDGWLLFGPGLGREA